MGKHTVQHPTSKHYIHLNNYPHVGDTDSVDEMYISISPCLHAAMCKHASSFDKFKGSAGAFMN